MLLKAILAVQLVSTTIATVSVLVTGAVKLIKGGGGSHVVTVRKIAQTEKHDH